MPSMNLISHNIDLLQNEFRYDFRKGPREISAGTEFTVFTVIKGYNANKYRKHRTGRNLTRTFPKIVPKFGLQKVYNKLPFSSDGSFLLLRELLLVVVTFLWTLDTCRMIMHSRCGLKLHKGCVI